ncbi:hypothetical protein [Planomonospora sp. ID82291]|uniref:hypothetical protein n=1 Tax=Planomonospora sp. ID82291 TaxID=2738136 RepID=UPI0018C3B45D|nr:hypothetical protein [Planomonospora sp. ID82291]MBG0818783.1 hypothetical protein [Planomonospora sp. ID82291]
MAISPRELPFCLWCQQPVVNGPRGLWIDATSGSPVCPRAYRDNQHIPDPDPEPDLGPAPVRVRLTRTASGATFTWNDPQSTPHAYEITWDAACGCLALCWQTPAGGFGPAPLLPAPTLTLARAIVENFVATYAWIDPNALDLLTD